MKLAALMTVAALTIPQVAYAAPGVGDPVYGATIEKGMTEFEARYGHLTGGNENGADGLVLEVEHAFSNKFAAAMLVETARDPGGRRIAESVSVEGIRTLGRINALALDVAVYGEYKVAFRGAPDVFEGKLLLEHRVGLFDSRLNLIAEKALRSGEPVEFGYAASADWAIFGDDLRLGAAAFGDLGTGDHFGGRQETYAGPEIKTDIEHLAGGELEIEAGWLRAFGAARDHADGQARLLIGYERRF